MADYIRWFRFEPESHGADFVWMQRHEKNGKFNYDQGYRVSANFLNWATEKYDAKIVTEVGAALRDDKYTDDFWKQHTGKTLEDLGTEWKQAALKQINSVATNNAQG
jgi:hypothetical protein